MADPATELTLHSSWRGIVASFAGALVVTAIGALVIAYNGAAVLSVLVTVVGVGFLATVVFDYPVASTFTADGIERRMMLRRQTIPWADVRQLSRSRPGLTKGIRGLRHGGLVAVVGRRRYLLVDQCEARTEYDVLAPIVAVAEADLGRELGWDGLGEPEEKVPPTWVSRRSRWNPNTAQHR